MTKTIAGSLHSLVKTYHLKAIAPDNPALACGSLYRFNLEGGDGRCWLYPSGHGAALIILNFAFDKEFFFPSAEFGCLFFNYFLQIEGVSVLLSDTSSSLHGNTIYLHYLPEQERMVRLAPGSTVEGVILMIEPDFFKDIINRYTTRAFGLSDLQSGSFVCDKTAGGIATVVDQVMNCTLTGKESLIRDYFNNKTKELMMLFIDALVCQHDSGALQCADFNLNPVKSGLVKADDYEHIQALLQYMQSNLSREVTLEDLSARSLMSRRKLTSSFKLVTGLTVQEYHSLLRLRRAQVLLRDTVTSVGDIAKELGFSGPSSFSNFFRRQTGITPSEFRKGYL